MMVPGSIPGKGSPMVVPKIRRHGAEAARRAHNPEVTGSKPVAGILFTRGHARVRCCLRSGSMSNYFFIGALYDICAHKNKKVLEYTHIHTILTEGMGRGCGGTEGSPVSTRRGWRRPGTPH